MVGYYMVYSSGTYQVASPLGFIFYFPFLSFSVVLTTTLYYTIRICFNFCYTKL